MEIPMADNPSSQPTPSTDPAFRSRKSTAGSQALTHQRIADDLAAFHQAGGQIEVLSVTGNRKPEEATDATHSAPARPYSGPRRGPGGRSG
jgi:hypothetical protein